MRDFMESSSGDQKWALRPVKQLFEIEYSVKSAESQWGDYSLHDEHGARIRETESGGIQGDSL